MSEFAELILAAKAAVDALRSYQYGNAATELAAEVADALEAAIMKTMHERDNDLGQNSRYLQECAQHLQELEKVLRSIKEAKT